MSLAIQGAIWVGAGVTLILLLSRRPQPPGVAVVSAKSGWREVGGQAVLPSALDAP